MREAGEMVVEREGLGGLCASELGLPSLFVGDVSFCFRPFPRLKHTAGLALCCNSNPELPFSRPNPFSPSLCVRRCDLSLPSIFLVYRQDGAITFRCSERQRRLARRCGSVAISGEGKLPRERSSPFGRLCNLPTFRMPPECSVSAAPYLACSGPAQVFL